MIVVDTHILIWMYLATEKLSGVAIKAIFEANFLLIPSISLWEVSMLVNYRRLELPCSLSDWLNTVLEQSVKNSAAPENEIRRINQSSQLKRPTMRTWQRILHLPIIFLQST
jgi:PIN domain nuclease of toxin-antitoxin system